MSCRLYLVPELMFQLLMQEFISEKPPVRFPCTPFCLSSLLIFSPQCMLFASPINACCQAKTQAKCICSTANHLKGRTFWYHKRHNNNSSKNLSVQMVCSALSTLRSMGTTVYTLDTQPGNTVSMERKSFLLKEFLFTIQHAVLPDNSDGEELTAWMSLFPSYQPSRGISNGMRGE